MAKIRKKYDPNKTARRMRNPVLGLATVRKIDKKIALPIIEPVEIALIKYHFGTFDAKDFDTLLFFHRIIDRIRKSEPMPLFDPAVADSFDYVLNQLRDHYFENNEYKFDDRYGRVLDDIIGHCSEQILHASRDGFIKAVTDEYNQQQLKKAQDTQMLLREGDFVIDSSLKDEKVIVYNDESVGVLEFKPPANGWSYDALLQILSLDQHLAELVSCFSKPKIKLGDRVLYVADV